MTTTDHMDHMHKAAPRSTGQATIKDVVDAIDRQTAVIERALEPLHLIIPAVDETTILTPMMWDAATRRRIRPRGDAQPSEASQGTPSARSVPRSHTEWVPKGLIEHLCRQQTFAPDSDTSDAMQALINVLHDHRPIGNDGKHGERHTDTCGCEDKPATDVPEPAQTLADLTPCLGDRVRVKGAFGKEYRFACGWFQSTPTNGFFAWCNEDDRTYLPLDHEWTVLEHLDPVTPEEPPVGAGMLVDRKRRLRIRLEDGRWMVHTSAGWMPSFGWGNITDRYGPLRPATPADLAEHGVDEQGEPVGKGEWSVKTDEVGDRILMRNGVQVADEAAAERPEDFTALVAAVTEDGAR